MPRPRKTGLSSKEIFDQIHGGANTNHVYTGLVAEQDDERIKFSLGTSCREWLNIDSNLVEKAVFVKMVRCGDHTHPLVHLFMRAPETPEGEAFAGISKQMAAFQTTATENLFDRRVCPPGTHWQIDPMTGEGMCVRDLEGT